MAKWRGGGSGGRGLYLYDGTLFPSTPSDWTTYIRGTCYIAYQSQFIFQDGNSANLPTQASVESLADAAVASGKNIACTDIESWSAQGLATMKTKYEQVFSWWKARQPASKIGQFTYNPTNDSTAAIAAQTSGTYTTWQAANDTVYWTNSDILYPSLYLDFYEASPYTNSVLFMQQMLREAKRVAVNGELIIPFITMCYSSSLTSMWNTISGISTANPAVITTSATTNVQTGDQVWLGGLTGAALGGLNNTLVRVTRVDGTHLSIDGYNGTSLNVTGGNYYAVLRSDLWRKVLEVVASHAGSAVLWGPYTDLTFSNGADWWSATKAFQSGS